MDRPDEPDHSHATPPEQRPASQASPAAPLLQQPRKRHTSNPSRHGRLWKLINELAPSLTVAALLLALVELFFVHTMRQNLDHLAKSATTRYVGTFPGNLPEINELILQTHEKLVIVADAVAYGHVSDPPRFDEYLQAIKNRTRAGVEITIRTYSGAKLREARENQFGTDYEAIKKKPALISYFGLNPNLTKPADLDSFHDLLDGNELRCKCELFASGVGLDEVAKDLPVFLWLSDDKDAIFSFYGYGDDPREVSFKTRDTDLIATLKEITSKIKSVPFQGQVMCAKK